MASCKNLWNQHFSFKQHTRWKTFFSRLDILQLPHVDSGPLLARATLQEIVIEEAFVDDIIVDLVDDVLEVVVLLEEPEELGRRPVDGHVPGVHVLLRQHVLEQLPPAPGPLTRLVDVEVEDTHGTDLVLLPPPIQQEEVLLPNLEETDYRVVGEVDQQVDDVLLHVPDFRGARDGGFEDLSDRGRLAHHVDDLHDFLLNLSHGLVAVRRPGRQAPLREHVTADPDDFGRKNFRETESKIHSEVELLFFLLALLSHDHK